MLAGRLETARLIRCRRRAFIVAVEQSTGKIRWRTDRKIDSASYSVPTVRKNEAGQDELLCNTQAEGLFALDPKTGKENWSAPVLSMRSVSCPLYVAGLVFGTTGSGGGGHYLVTVKPGKEPQEEYRIKQNAPYVATPVCRGNLMFLFEDRQGHASCIDAATGKVLWFKPRLGATFFGSPVRAGDKIFCVDTEGTVICMAAEQGIQRAGPHGAQGAVPQHARDRRRARCMCGRCRTCCRVGGKSNL